MAELLLLRLALLAVLFVFIVAVALSMRSALALAPRSRAVAARPRARLAVMAPAASGLRPGATVELAGIMTIGRDQRNSIVVADASVSAVHAELRFQEGAWRVADLGSTNGTLVDGAGVDGIGQVLRGGERIAVGAVVFQFRP